MMIKKSIFLIFFTALPVNFPIYSMKNIAPDKAQLSSFMYNCSKALALGEVTSLAYCYSPKVRRACEAVQDTLWLYKNPLGMIASAGALAMFSSLIKNSSSGTFNIMAGSIFTGALATAFVINKIRANNPAERFINEMYSLLNDIPALDTEEFNIRLNFFRVYALDPRVDGLADPASAPLHYGPLKMLIKGRLEIKGLIQSFEYYHTNYANCDKYSNKAFYMQAKTVVNTIAKVIRATPDIITLPKS